MTGYEYIRSGLELFEAALSGDAVGSSPGAAGAAGPSKEAEALPRTVAALAARVGYSPYHFARLFYAVVGTAPKEYMEGRILTEAAKRILAVDETLAAVAAKAGFKDYETFSRAVRRRFGRAPREIRALGYLPGPATEAVRLGPHPPSPDSGLASREPDVADEPERFLAGMSFYMEEGTRSFHKPWATFMKVQDRIAGRKIPGTFYQWSSWIDGDVLGGITILCAVEVDGGGIEEDFFQVRRIPPARCLRFVHRGGPEGLYETYRYIYQDFLARRDIRPAQRWEFQRYNPDGTTDICIPV